MLTVTFADNSSMELIDCHLAEPRLIFEVPDMGAFSFLFEKFSDTELTKRLDFYKNGHYITSFECCSVSSTQIYPTGTGSYSIFLMMNGVPMREPYLEVPNE